MNAKQKRTLAAIFSDPVSASISWKNIESLFIAIGAEKVEGRGSRVRFHKADIVASFHRPHPRKEAKIYQVKDARVFLERLGVGP